MEFSAIVSYFTGIHFIKPNLEASSLLRTAAILHLLDAILCGLMAGQSGRNRNIWTVAGLLLGIWALGTLFLLPSKKREAKGPAN